MGYWWKEKYIEKGIEELLGKTLSSIDVNNDKDEMIFTTKEGEQYKLYHDQDCCESVTIEDIDNDLDVLLNSSIVMAEEVTSDKNPKGITKEYQNSFTWTFYKLGTAKGQVTIRWYGASNGYYSERVDFTRIK